MLPPLPDLTGSPALFACLLDFALAGAFLGELFFFAALPERLLASALLFWLWEYLFSSASASSGFTNPLRPGDQLAVIFFNAALLGLWQGVLPSALEVCSGDPQVSQGGLVRVPAPTLPCLELCVGDLQRREEAGEGHLLP